MSYITYNFVLGVLTSLGTYPDPSVSIQLYDGLYDKSTYVDTGSHITADVNLELNGAIDHIFLGFNVEYEEMTPDRDNPHFEITVHDDTDNYLASVQNTLRDIAIEFNTFYKLNQPMQLEIPIYEFTDAVVEYTQTFKLNVEVLLEKWEWSGNSPLPSQIKTAELNINFTVKQGTTFQTRPPSTGDENFLAFDVQGATQNPDPQNLSVSWKTWYFPKISVKVKSQNLPATFSNNVELDYIQPETDYHGENYCSQKEILDYIRRSERLPGEFKTEVQTDFKITEDFPVSIQEGPVIYVHDFRDKQSWEWYNMEDIHFLEHVPRWGDAPDWLTALAQSIMRPQKYPCPRKPWKRVYRWSLEISGITDLLSENSSITVIVPWAKLNKIVQGIDKWVEAMIFFTINIYVFIGGLIWSPLLIPGIIVYFILDILMTDYIKVAQGYFNEAITHCSRDFRSDYKEVYDHLSKARKEILIDANYPDEYRIFINSSKKIIILTEALDITFSKYLSALKMEDKDAILLQKTECFKIMAQLEDEILRVRISKNIIVPALSKPPLEYGEFISKVNEDLEKGLSNEQKEQLNEKGIPNEIIGMLEAGDISLDVGADAYKAYFKESSLLIDKSDVGLLDFYFKSLELIKEVRRIDKLFAGDLIIELFKYGILSLEEYHALLQKTGLSHFLTTVGLPEQNLGSLAENGIFTTAGYLSRCKTRANRTKLEKELGIPDFDVVWWANICDLMRIEGITKVWAKLLEKAGVDTVVELSKRNWSNLLKTMQKLSKTCPRQEEIQSWIEKAKGLKRMLRY